DACDDIAGVELRGKLAREPRVATVVRFHSGQRPDRFVHVAEAEETFVVGQDAARARVLDHRRLAPGAIAERPVAVPRVREGYAGQLRAAELPSRLLDVRAVPLERRGHLPGLADPPSERFHAGTPLLVALGQADGQLEPYGGLGGKVLVFKEGDVLLLVDDPSLELERAAPPVGDRGVWRARAHWGRRPLAQEDGRP